ALALMAAGEHKAVQVQPGDLVIISARVIPGNERTIGRVVNALYRLGAEVLYEDNAFVHVSGHASQEDLKLMLNLTRPRYFIPVHGEYRHLLGHARLAESVGLEPDRVLLIEDGTGVEVTKTTARVVGGFPAGRVLVDGKSVGEIGAVVLRDRQPPPADGLISVSGAVRPPRNRRPRTDRWLSEVKGILALAVAGFGLIALATFDPSRPPAVQQGPVGPVGVWLGWAAFQSFGYAGFLFPLLLGAWGASAFVRPPVTRGVLP